MNPIMPFAMDGSSRGPMAITARIINAIAVNRSTQSARLKNNHHRRTMSAAANPAMIALPPNCGNTSGMAYINSHCRVTANTPGHRRSGFRASGVLAIMWTVYMTRIVSAAVVTLICMTTVVAQRPSVPPADDAAAGKLIFEGAGRCLRCHSVNERGGTLGPDLSWIGALRTDESLTTSLLDPDAQISHGYITVIVETKAGNRIEGVALNEDVLSIQLRDIRGNLRSFIKGELKHCRRDPRSLMPSYRSTLSPSDISHVVAYLTTLKNFPALTILERAREIPAATENTSFFDRPARDREDHPDLVLPALEIRAGATVADIGSGTGYFTWRLADQV